MPLVVNGWTLLYHPVFGQRYAELRHEARRLKRELPADEFAAHPTVRRAAAIHRLVMDIVPRGPNAPEFRLKANLGKFRRAKGRGLPPRYRLFWIFSQIARAIIFLYVNDEATLRKEGAKTDPYEIFRASVSRGEVGADFEANLRAWREGHPEAS